MSVKVKNLSAILGAGGLAVIPALTVGEIVSFSAAAAPTPAFQCSFTYNSATIVSWLTLSEINVVGGFPALLTWMFGGIAISSVSWGAVSEDFEPIVGTDSYSRQRSIKITFATGHVVVLEIDRATGGFVFGVG